MATLLRRFIRVGQTDKTSDTNLILQTITIKFRRRYTDAFQRNLIAWIKIDWSIFVCKATYKLGLNNQPSQGSKIVHGHRWSRFQ